MSEPADQYMLIPGDPDPREAIMDPLDGGFLVPADLFDTVKAAIGQPGPIEPVALQGWLTAIVETGGPPANTDTETAVSQALGASWRSSSARAEDAVGTGDQPEVQRHIDIVIDGLANRDKSIVSDRDRPRLRKALDDAEKPLAGRHGADVGVGRAIGARSAG